MSPAIVIEKGTRQLLIDDWLIESTVNVKRVVNQPRKYENNPILAPDQVWEGQEGLIYPTGCVMYDAEAGLFKMWYQIVNYSWTESMLAYATSDDGIEWTKPDTGFMYPLARRKGARGTNIVLLAGGHSFDWPIVWKDPHEQDANKRYKLAFGMPYGVIRGIGKSFHVVAGPQHFGMGVGFSPDGRHWDLHPGNPVLSFEGEAPFALLWEPKSRKYVCYVRLWADPAHPNSLTRLGVGGVRVVGRTESEDFIHWTNPTVCLRWDDSDHELNRHIYNMEVMEYQGLYLGILSMYHVTGVPDAHRKQGIEYVSSLPESVAGLDTVDIHLAVSRDTWTWQRVGNEAWERVGGQGTFIQLGQEGEFDSAMLYALQAPLVVGDEVWVYYAGMRDKHWSTRRGEPQRGALGLARLRRDRFVSVESQERKVGVLTTRPLALKGKKLEVNCDASNGNLSVEALDARGNVIDGFGREECKAVRGDQVSAKLQWDGGGIAVLGREPIRLRFFLENARLYSFVALD